MDQRERDNGQLGIILKYCDRMRQSVDYFGDDYTVFERSTPFQDSCSLCLIQIGEAVHRLSDEFTAAHPQIEWSKIYGMRCHLVHGYEMFDTEIVWDAVETFLPPLREFCLEHFVEQIMRQ